MPIWSPDRISDAASSALIIRRARVGFKIREVVIGNARVAIAGAPSIENKQLNCHSEAKRGIWAVAGRRRNPPRSTAFTVAARLPAVCELDHGTKNIFLHVEVLLAAPSP